MKIIVHRHGKPGSWRRAPDAEARRSVLDVGRAHRHISHYRSGASEISGGRSLQHQAHAIATMPPSRKCQSSRTNPPVSLQEGRLGQQKRNLYDEQWNARFKELLDYRSQHGDCNVPQKHGTLGTWVTSQRSAYRDEKLAQDRIDRLNSIGFKWTLKEGGPKVPWETRFNELVQYKAKHGDCNIPRRQGQLGDKEASSVSPTGMTSLSKIALIVSMVLASTGRR